MLPLLHSDKVMKKVARAQELLTCIIEDSMERASVDSGNCHRLSGLRVIAYTVEHCNQQALSNNILALCFGFIQNPVDKEYLRDALFIMLALDDSQIRLHKCPQAVLHCLVALAACEAAEPDSRQMAATLVMSFSKRWTDKVNHHLFPRPQPFESMEVPQLVCKALRRLCLCDENIRERLRQFDAFHSRPSSNKAQAALRECSNPGCQKVEMKEQKFKVCAGCSLALFCSKGEYWQPSPLSLLSLLISNSTQAC